MVWLWAWRPIRRRICHVFNSVGDQVPPGAPTVEVSMPPTVHPLHRAVRRRDHHRAGKGVRLQPGNPFARDPAIRAACAAPEARGVSTDEDVPRAARSSTQPALPGDLHRYKHRAIAIVEDAAEAIHPSALSAATTDFFNACQGSDFGGCRTRETRRHPCGPPGSAVGETPRLPLCVSAIHGY